jgi:hypothetical protein
MSAYVSIRCDAYVGIHAEVFGEDVEPLMPAHLDPLPSHSHEKDRLKRMAPK